MTSPESTTMNVDDKEAQREQARRRGLRAHPHGPALARLDHGRPGFEVGRNRAMREAYTNQPAGRGYNEAFGRWMDRRSVGAQDRQGHAQPPAVDRRPPARDRGVARDAAGEPARRVEPPDHRQARLRTGACASRVAKAEGEPVKSPMAQLKEALIETQTERDHWKRQAEEGGSMFDLRRDTPEMIARILVESVTPSRAENIAKAIRAELKRQKQAHAG